MKVGRDYGIRNVGHLAMRFLRIEKFIPFWAEELTSITTPNEVNRTFKVKFDKEYFIGKEALLKHKDDDIWPWGGEAVYRNGEFVGFVTSTAYGFTLHKMVALGFVQHPLTLGGQKTPVEASWIADRSATWTIDIAGKMCPVTVHLHPPKMPIITQEGAAADYKPKKHYPNVQLLKKIKEREAKS